MSSLLYDLGRLCFRKGRAVVAVWLLLLLLGGGAVGLLSNGTHEVYRVPGSEGQAALDSLEGRFPELSGAAAQIVVEVPAGARADDARTRRLVDGLVDSVRDIRGVADVADPYSEDVEGALSDDHRAVLVSAQLDEQPIDVDPATLDALSDSVTPLRDAGYTAEVGGAAFMSPPPRMSLLEVAGLLIAAVVLFVTFRSARAALSPLASALVGAAATAAVVMSATAFIDVPGTAPMLALMIGVAVGIDYALFILSRHREQLAEGADPAESAGVATATAGSAVVFAGLTVFIALLALSVPGLPFLGIMGVAAAAGVAFAVLAALTFLPALMGIMGERLRPRHARPVAARATREDSTATPELETASGVRSGAEAGRGSTHPAQQAAVADAGAGAPLPAEDRGDDTGTVAAGARRVGQAGEDATTRVGEDDAVTARAAARPRGGWAQRWVRIVTAVPALTVAVVTAALVALALPAADLQLALPDNGARPVSESPRRAYDLISRHFGPGANGPLLVTADIIDSGDPVVLMKSLEREIAAVPGVQRIALSTPNRTADTGVVIVIPETGPTDPATARLVRDLRDRLPQVERDYDVDLAVTGQTAIQIDISDRLARAGVPFAVVVMGLSLVLLTIVFRSLLVPLTATLGFVLSTAATFGVVAEVFEHGRFADALGVARIGPVISFMPIIVMGVLFGLAMDYQVFLVSRMREAHVRGAAPREAVQQGFIGSGPVVAAAAAIMVTVFASFVPHGDANLKPIAFALTVGVVLDAVVVRMILMPAVLALCGGLTWAFPAWLDRRVPHMDVEGGVVQDHLARSREISAHPDRIVDVRGMRIVGALGPVVNGFDITVHESGICVLQGSDGSGKTSVLMALAGRMPFEAEFAEVAGFALPEQSRHVQHVVSLAEFAGVNDLDDSLPLSTHIAERLSTRTLMPWTRSRDVARVMDRYTAALVAAGSYGGAAVSRTDIASTWSVGDLLGVERVLFAAVLADVGDPRMIVVDETGDLRSADDRAAVLAGLGYLVRSAASSLTIVLSRTDPADSDTLARIAGLDRARIEVRNLPRPVLPGLPQPVAQTLPMPPTPPVHDIHPEVTR